MTGDRQIGNRQNLSTKMYRPILLTVFLSMTSVAFGKDATIAHEVFIRSLKLGGQYTQVTYTNPRYVAPGSNGIATSQTSTLPLYGPLLGPGVYIAPTRYFHINLGLDLGALFSSSPFYNTSTTTLYFSGYANFGIRLGDLWPFAGINYTSFTLENSLVAAQAGLEYKSDSWLYGLMATKSVSSSDPGGNTAYINVQNWSVQLYATWLWGRWY